MGLELDAGVVFWRYSCSISSTLISREVRCRRVFLEVALVVFGETSSWLPHAAPIECYFMIINCFSDEFNK